MPGNFKGSRRVLESTISIASDPDTIFPLLCPVREAEWLEGWEGRPIFAASGVAELDGVYSTAHGGEEDTLWVITRFEPARRELEFVSFIPEMQVVHLGIRVAPEGKDRSRLSVRYVRTGLSDRGNLAIEQLATTGEFAAMMSDWERSMNRFLQAGARPPGAA